MKPVLVVPGTDYVVCFAATPEEIGMRHHFVKECGWTAKQYRSIKDMDWFCAEVSLWKGGKELGTQYLGYCCYKTADEFWTRYAGDYFADMVCELALESKDKNLHAWALQWRGSLCEKEAA